MRENETFPPRFEFMWPGRCVGLYSVPARLGKGQGAK